MPRQPPLVSFDVGPPSTRSKSEIHHPPKKTWMTFFPLFVLVALILAPHPSLLIVLVNHYLLALKSTLLFAIHLFITYTLTFLAFTSLIVCLARDPGPVPQKVDADSEPENEELDFNQALIFDLDDDESSPVKWCRICDAHKPERTHHCSVCGRCVLKMDHHCPWLASRCIGHRTYPAFFHFLCCITSLSIYIAGLSGYAFWCSFNKPLSIDPYTPVHEIFLFFAGIICSLVLGSFLAYHINLITTNQTTLESMSPFLLLRYLPPLAPGPTTIRLSDPPMEHELSYAQRKLVLRAHRSVRLYDIGWRRNWVQVFGWRKKWGWIYRLTTGGAGMGTGSTFPRNPRAPEMLSTLAAKLAAVDRGS